MRTLITTAIIIASISTAASASDYGDLMRQSAKDARAGAQAGVAGGRHGVDSAREAWGMEPLYKNPKTTKQYIYYQPGVIVTEQPKRYDNTVIHGSNGAVIHDNEQTGRTVITNPDGTTVIIDE